MARRSPPLERFDMTAPVAADFARMPMDDGELARAAGRAVSNIGNILSKLAAAGEARALQRQVEDASAEGARDASSAVALPGQSVAPSQQAAPAPQADGPDALALIRKFEGFRAAPYWDVNAHRAGYGSDTVTYADGRVARIKPGMTVSREDAERDLARRAAEFATKAAGQVGDKRWQALPGNVRAALTSVAYNYGSLPDRILGAVKSGDPGQIAAAVRGLGGDNDGINARRRAMEADVIAGGKAGFAMPEIRPLQLRKSGSPQDEAYNAALLKAGAYRAKAAMAAGLDALAEQFADDPDGFEKEAVKLQRQYVGAFADVPELQATADAEFFLNMEPVRRRIYDRRDAKAEADMKSAAAEAVMTQGALLEKQAYAIGVNADGDAHMAAISARAMTLIDSALEAGAISRPEAARQREAVLGRLTQARFDGVFDALAAPADKRAFAEKLKTPATRDELLAKVSLDDYKALVSRYDTLAGQAEREVTKASRLEKQKLATLIDDDIASMASTGKGVAVGGLPLDAREVARVLGPNEAGQWQAARAQAGRLFAATDGLSGLTEAEIGERLARLEPAAGAEGFAASQEIFSKAAKVADAILKRRADDPAAAVDEAFPELRDEALRKDPAALAAARMERQAALGIPDLARQPLTNPEARRIAARLTMYADNSEAQVTALNRLMAEMADGFGEHADEAVAQVLRVNGVSKETSTAAVDILKSLQVAAPPAVADVRRLQGAVKRDQAEQGMSGLRDFRAAPFAGRRGAGGQTVAPKPAKPAQPNAAQVELLRQHANDEKFIQWFDAKFGKDAAAGFLQVPPNDYERRTLEDGSTQLIYPNGWIETFHPDGRIDGRMGP